MKIQKLLSWFQNRTYFKATYTHVCKWWFHRFDSTNRLLSFWPRFTWNNHNVPYAKSAWYCFIVIISLCLCYCLLLGFWLCENLIRTLCSFLRVTTQSASDVSVTTNKRFSISFLDQIIFEQHKLSTQINISHCELLTRKIVIFFVFVWAYWIFYSL